MNRRGALLTLVAVIVALASAHFDSAQKAWAQSSGERQMIVFLVDGFAVRHSDQDADLTRSLISLIATLQNDRPITFISTDYPSENLGPFEAGDPNFSKVQDEFAASLAVPSLGKRWSVPEAIVETHDFMTRRRAGVGSQVYLITGPSPVAHFDGLSDVLSTLIARYGEMGWSIYGVNLSGGSPDVMEFLDGVSENSGGRAFELFESDGFRELADAILTQDAKGSLAPVGQSVMTANELMTSVIRIAPGTRETTVLISRVSSYGSLRLSGPSGFEVSAGDRTASYVVETPNVVIWRLIDPVPGNWKIDARGFEGLVSVWEYSSNKYSLVLSSASPLPLEKPATLMAYVEEDGQAVALQGVRLYANITTASGATMALEMKDTGTQGDATAGDGYFSLILPPLSVSGDYQVELELSWLEYDHRISAISSFQARPFPVIEVLPIQLQELEPGERTRVAKVFVHVHGEPYPVAVSQLTASLISPEGQRGTLDLEPQRLFGDGPAFEYEVFFTAEGYGHYSQVFSLSLEYAGRLFTYTSDSFVLSSVAPPAPAVSVVEPVSVAPPPPPPAPQAPLLPVLAPQVEASGLPWEVIVIPVVFLVGVAAAAIYILSRTRPYGYIYDDVDEPVIEFAQLKRHPVLALLFRGSVRGKELKVPGLEDVVFHFSKNRIRLRNLGRQPTVRVNNHPLIDQATLQHRTWIGARGKLFTFMLSPSPAQEGAGAD